MKRSTLLAALLWLPAALWAGPTAYISGPSTDFQGYLDPALGVAVNLAKGKDASGERPASVTGMGIISGFLPYKNFNLEAGFDYKSSGGSADDSPLCFNSKAGFPEGALGQGMPALVAGVFDLGTNADKNAYNVLYTLAGKTFRLGSFELGKFSAGWFRGNPDLLLDGNGRRDNSGPLAAWSRGLPEVSERLSVAVDYLGTQSAYGSLNFGLAWKFNSVVSLVAGYNAFNNTDIVDTYNVQLAMGLGSAPAR